MERLIDDLARAAAGGLSRRAVLRRLAAGIAGGALAALLPGAARAQLTGACREFCLNLTGAARGACLADAARGGGLCQACAGNVASLCEPISGDGPGVCCAAGQHCNSEGQCVPPIQGGGITCPPGTTFCGFSGCCPSGMVCQADVCVPAA
jgi:hypothetical protein